MSSRLSPALAAFAGSSWPDGHEPEYRREPSLYAPPLHDIIRHDMDRHDMRDLDPRALEPPLHPSEIDRFDRRQGVFRWLPVAFARFLVFFLVGVGATLAWQSYGHAGRRIVASLSPSLGWLAPPTASAASSAGPVAAAASPDQLAALSRSLASVRQSVDKLAADIGRLQTAKPDAQARTSAAPAAAGRSRPGTTAQAQPAQTSR